MGWSDRVLLARLRDCWRGRWRVRSSWRGRRDGGRVSCAGSRSRAERACRLLEETESVSRASKIVTLALTMLDD